MSMKWRVEQIVHWKNMEAITELPTTFESRYARFSLCASFRGQLSS